MDDDTYCTDCKKHTQVVHDHSSGDTICRECGLVLEAHSIDDTCEWRTFVLESAADRDPNRVGLASNPLLEHAHLTTTISKSGGPISSSSVDRRWETSHKASNPDPTLIQGFNTIATMSDRLALVTTVRDRANVVYKKVEDHKTIKGRKNQDAILAACLYIACIEEHTPRTLKEIASVANGATQKEICRAKKNIDNQFKLGMDVVVGGGDIHAADFVARFCSGLCLKFQTIKAAREAVNKLEELDIRRKPTSVVAAVIYMITQLSADDKRFLKDISSVTGVAESTISIAYRELYPYASRLIPCSYALEKDLKHLTAP